MQQESINKAKQLVSDLKIIYTDVDGTMVGPGGSIFRAADGSLTMEAANIIVKAITSGIDIVPVSGRNQDQLRENVRVLGLQNFIAELGAEIIYNQGERIIHTAEEIETHGKTVYETIKDRSITQKLLQHFSGRLEYHTPWSDERRFHSHLFRGFVSVNEVNSFLAANGSSDLKLVDNGRIGRRGDMPLEEVHAYHLLPKSVSKAKAVQRDQIERNIKIEQTIAIGDSWADLPLAEEVGAFFLVANGVKEDPTLADGIKAYDNAFVTENEKTLGWSEAVSLFLE